MPLLSEANALAGSCLVGFVGRWALIPSQHWARGNTVPLPVAPPVLCSTAPHPQSSLQCCSLLLARACPSVYHPILLPLWSATALTHRLFLACPSASGLVDAAHLPSVRLRRVGARLPGRLLICVTLDMDILKVRSSVRRHLHPTNHRYLERALHHLLPWL